MELRRVRPGQGKPEGDEDAAAYDDYEAQLRTTESLARLTRPADEAGADELAFGGRARIDRILSPPPPLHRRAPRGIGAVLAGWRTCALDREPGLRLSPTSEMLGRLHQRRQRVCGAVSTRDFL